MNSQTQFLAKHIKLARTDAGYSQQQLASLIGVSFKTISAYETGRTEPPFSKLLLLAQHCGKPISYFDETSKTSANEEIVIRFEKVTQDLSAIQLLLKKLTS